MKNKLMMQFNQLMKILEELQLNAKNEDERWLYEMVKANVAMQIARLTAYYDYVKK